MKHQKILTLTAVTAALAFGGSALAQEEYQAPPPQPETIDVSNQQLERFAHAQVEIIDIRQDFSARLQDVEDSEKAHELQLAANEEMTQAVKGAGLDVKAYNEIAMAIQSDPELQEKLNELMEK